MNTLFLSALRKFTSGILFLFVVTAIQAQSMPEKAPKKEETAQVKYPGNEPRMAGNEPLFNVIYTNNSGARFSVRVLDNEGHQLFQGVYTDKKFDRKFKVTDAGSYGKLVFVIRNFEDNSVQRLEVNSNTCMIEDADVTEVK